MDLKQIAERNEVDEDKNLLELNFYTDARTPAIRDALDFVTASCLNSSINFVKVERDIREGEDGENLSKEFIILDAEDVDAKFVQGLTQELLESLEYEYELGSNGANPDLLYVVVDLPREFIDEDELGDEE